MNNKQQNLSSSLPDKSHRDYGRLFKTIDHSYSEYSHRTNRNPQLSNIQYLKSKQLQSRLNNDNRKNQFFQLDDASSGSMDESKMIERSKTNNYLKLPAIKSKKNLEQRVSPYNKMNPRKAYLVPTTNSALRQRQLRDPKFRHKSICSVNCLRRHNQKKPKRISKKDDSPRIRQYLAEQAKAHYPQTQLNRYLSRMKLEEDQKRSKLVYQTYFGIQPQFYKLQTQYAKQLSAQIINKSVVIQQKIRTQIPMIPDQEQLPQFIQQYPPYNKEIDLQKLLKSPRFLIEYSKNELFFGQMVGNKKQGKGIAIENGKVFEGIFRNNFKVKGIQINASGTYKGQFLNEKRNGGGQFQWLNGEYYIGEWKDGNRHGIGVWTNRFGDSYNGQWKMGKGEGYGVYIVAGQEYKGNFVNFKKEGWGKQSFINGDRFEGQFRQGLPGGKGRYVWHNGTKYEGQFVTGLRNGKGTLKTPDGFIYKGEFQDERPQGLCQIYIPNGDAYHGYLKQGRKNGRGTLFLEDSQKVLDGYWQDDNFIESISA